MSTAHWQARRLPIPAPCLVRSSSGSEPDALVVKRLKMPAEIARWVFGVIWNHHSEGVGLAPGLEFTQDGLDGLARVGQEVLVARGCSL